MSSQKKIADLLFWVQILCTLIFGGSQFVQMLSSSNGVSISWFASWEMFLSINLVLALRAHRARSSRVTFQTILSYLVWVTMITLDLGAMLWNHLGIWSERDTITVLCVVIGSIATLVIAKQKHLMMSDPIVKGYLAVFFKGVPQLVLAWNMMLLGSEGIALLAIIAGHVTILTRLGQLWFSIREAGWDRNRVGSAISELANEGSWIVVTIVWLVC